ncbi:hypothetical protein Bca52824_026138 [Brassica carinata]|uniref:F-box domain-containing protein n=1 Tax=Brassica carinata TaxID=52824 RepID=A0A8X7V7L5_BRACI|nr:hypothetical protein Bca52824_026138 [Brassica carinata]
MKISNLPMDLMEEILYRVPVKSIGAVRSTCKNWNVLCKDERFAKKHIDKAAREKLVLAITGNTKNHLISIKFYDFHNKNFDISINSIGKLVTQENSDLVVVRRVFYCNGLLMYLCGHIKRGLFVWNPYWGKTRWVNCPTERSYEVFSLGYDKSCGGHKILRLSSHDNNVIHIDIYDVSSDSWKTHDAAFHNNIIEYTEPVLSLKGNTYWHVVSGYGFLQCFDFTRERLGPCLPPPFDMSYGCIGSLYSVKEEKLGLLLIQQGGFEIDVWVTNMIEPDAVSWSKLFKAETLQLYRGFLFGSFLIDEENKIVVIFDSYHICYNTNTNKIDGESGHFRKVEKIESPRL